MPLNELTIKQAVEKLDKGDITSLELTKDCLSRIKELNGELNACLTVCEQEALAEAEAADKRRESGQKGGLLGVPYICKDNIMTKGIRTTAASKILEDYTAPYDATIIKKLREAGAVLLAKSNLDEFAHGASNENSAFGPVRNPWDKERVPGGSSGGSAAAVASDMCLFALGTDTGGSIRCPASFCSVVGLKPTYGRSSRFGLLAMTSSTDVPGPLAKTAEDASMVLEVIAGHDKRDASSSDKDVPDHRKGMNKSLKGLKIGLPEEYFPEDLNKEVGDNISRAIEKLKELGAETVKVSLPHSKYAIPVYYIITPSEISSNLARFDGIKYGFSDEQAEDLKEIYLNSRGSGFGKEVKRRVMIGTYVLSAGYRDAYYIKAQKTRTIIKKEMDAELEKLDCLLTPTQPTAAFKIGEHSNNPLDMYLEDMFVAGASLAGLPAISIPCGFTGGLPTGMQLIGKRFDESRLFNVAYQYQQATDFHKQKPE